MNNKKIFLISGALLAALVLTIVLIPILFKGKIVKSVKEMANSSLMAKLDFKEAEVSIFRNFPELNVRLKELTIQGINEFEGKSLLQAESLSTSISLSSLWKTDGITVSGIILQDPRFELLVSPTGKANWDISKPADKKSVGTTKAPMKIELTKIQLLNTSLSYRDEKEKLISGFKGGNFELAGFLKGSDSKLNFKGLVDSLHFSYGGNQLVSGMKVSGEGTLQSNFDQMSFRFLDNKFRINQLPVALQGSFAVGEKEDQYDLTFQSTGSSLEELIGFLPQPQQQKLKNYEKGGTLIFTGLVKGSYSATTFPALQADLKLVDGRLKYPAMPNEINKIALEARLAKPQGSMDSLEINISKIEATVAGHLVVADLTIATPVSNPALKGNIVGEIDFPSLKNTIPLDSMEIGGTLQTNVHFDGSYAAIDKGEYDKFQTKGTLSVKDFFYRSPAFPERIGIQSAGFLFNSKEVSISAMKGKLGLSDFTVDGSISNYWAYILKDGVLQGNIKVKSALLEVTQLMNGGGKSSDSVQSEPYVIPARVNLTVLADISRMLYNRMEIRQTTGKLVVSDQKLNLDQLSMNLLGGKMVLSGVYSAIEKNPADFNFNIDIKDFDLPTAYQSLGVVRHMLPIAGKSKGTFLSELSLGGKLGRGYAPYFETLNGNGQISVKNLELVGAGMFEEIGKYFRKDLFTNVKVNDFTSNILLTNGALSVSPFTTKVANQEVTVSGSQSLALDLNYLFYFKVNKNDLSAEVTSFIGMVPGTENIDKYPIKINVVGNLKKPDVKIDLSEAKDLVAKEFSKKAKSTLQDAAKKFGFEGLFK